MANGDAASELGWNTFASTQDRRQGFDNDNYILDKVAGVYKTVRDQVLPTVSQPVFKAGRSTSYMAFNQQKWAYLPGPVWASPLLNSGFTRWVDGQLTIAKAGVYRITAHASATIEQSNIAVQVTRNTFTPDTASTLVKNDAKGAGVTATDMVRLAVGDILVTLVYMNSGTDKVLNNNPYDLSLSLEWLRS